LGVFSRLISEESYYCKWVDEDRRITIDAGILESAFNIKLRSGQTIHLWAVLGATGQVQLLPPSSELAQQRESYSKVSSPQQLPWDASSGKKAGLFRQLSAISQVSCHVRGKKVRLTLPSDIVDLEILRCDEPLVVSRVGEVLELWRKDHWLSASAVADLKLLTRQARDALDVD